MSPHLAGILIGGLIPAIFFGLANFLLKLAGNTGVSMGYFLLCAAPGFVVAGLILLLLSPERTISMESAVIAMSWGVLGGLGGGFVVMAVAKYHVSIGVLTPLFNMNTLITVLLALIVLAEWKEVRVPHLLLGSVLIVAGGTIVARA